MQFSHANSKTTAMRVNCIPSNGTELNGTEQNGTKSVPTEWNGRSVLTILQWNRWKWKLFLRATVFKVCIPTLSIYMRDSVNVKWGHSQCSLIISVMYRTVASTSVLPGNLLTIISFTTSPPCLMIMMASSCGMPSVAFPLISSSSSPTCGCGVQGS